MMNIKKEVDLQVSGTRRGACVIMLYPPCAPSRTQADRQRGSASRIGLHAKRVADADT